MSVYPKVTFGIIVLNGEPFTKYCLRSLYRFAHEIIVVEGASQKASCISTPDGHSRDGTLHSLYEFKKHEDPEGKLRIITKDNFWPEKDEQSQAYTKIATGDYLWQVDIDEFYMPEDIDYILRMLQDDREISIVSFKQITFWGDICYRCDSTYSLLNGSQPVYRVFKFGKGYRYISHRPPAVVDANGIDLRKRKHIDAEQTAARRIYLYHYSLLFPKQVRDKVAYYKNLPYEQCRKMPEWADNNYHRISNPFNVFNVHTYPGWLERYNGKHPPNVYSMMQDVKSGKSPVQIRCNSDVEAFIDNQKYRLAINLIKEDYKKRADKTIRINDDIFDDRLFREFLTEYSQKHVRPVEQPRFEGTCREERHGKSFIIPPCNYDYHLHNPQEGHKSSKQLSIVHINTHDVAGGAARVAWRLVQAQREVGHDSKMLVGKKVSNSKCSFSFPIDPDAFIQDQCRRKGQLFYEFQGSHRLVNSPLVRSADILHLHNLHGSYFNPFSLSALSHLKPVLWTLHDMQSITGHCAHSFDCEKWQNGCNKCPYLEIPFGIPVDSSAQLLRDKKLIYDNSYLQIVTPSQWLKNKVERSVLSNHPVELIYNGIDTNIFRPYDKKEARKKYHIPEDALVIGAVAHSGPLSNYWKGGKYTQVALDTLRGKFPNYVFVNIGADYKTGNPQIVSIPHISDEAELAQAYSILDMFLYTPVADNCPLVVLEALSCGIPVVTFKTGGIPELVRDGMDGYVSAYRNVPELVQAVERLAVNCSLRSEYSRNAREQAISKFDHKITAKQYQDLYERYLQESSSKPRRVKLFPLEKVPKIILTEAFAIAENSKKILPNVDKVNQQGGKFLKKGDRGKKLGVFTKTGETPPGIASPQKEQMQSEKGEHLISAIVSVYNAEQFIRGCLEDLERQTIANQLEIIVVNSGSEQNEEAIVKEFQQKYNNVKYIKTKERETIYKAWNRAIEIASGKYIANANADDRRRKDAMEIMSQVLDNNPEVALVYADQIITERENETFEDNTSSEDLKYPDFTPDIFLKIGWCNIGSQPMWRASLHKELGLFDENFEVAGDYDFLLRVCDKHKCFHIPEFLGAFYRAPGTVSRAKFFRLNQIENPLAKARALLRKGKQCVEKQDFSKAMRYLGQSLRLWSSREAAQYLKTAAEMTGCSRVNVDEEIKRLPSICELPGSKSENNAEQFKLDKGYYCANDDGILLSAIICSNAQWPARDCLESVENQTIADRLEIVVVHSNFNLQNEVVVKESQQKYNNVKCVQAQNGEPIYTALNKAIKATSGKYIALLNSNCRYRTDVLESMVQALDSDPDSAAVYVNEKSSEKVKDVSIFSKDRLLREDFIGLPVVWHRDLHKQFGYFDETFSLVGEYEFWHRIAQRYSFLHLDIDIGQHREKRNDVEDDDDRFIGHFETAVIQKAYQYAHLNSILINERGITDTPPFSSWCETNIVKKKTKERLTNQTLDPIAEVYDFRVLNAPSLSVIVVTYNRPADLLESLGALCKQTEKNFELIVINNGRTISQLTQRDKQPYDLCYIELTNNYGPSLGRNVGAKFAKAPYIAFLDDDAIADEDFVRNIVKHFKNYAIFALRGKVLPKIGDFNSDFLDLGDKIMPSTIEPEGNCAFRRDIFLKHNGFDEYLFHGEGGDLAYRIYKSENERLESILYFPDVVVYHDSYVMSHDNTERIVRINTIGKLLTQKDPEIKSYLNYFGSFYPANKNDIENDYNQLMTNVSFLQEHHPEEALKWAERAATLNPDAITCRYTLGSLYMNVDRYDQAQVVFEKIFEDLSRALAKGDLKSLRSSFKDSTAIGLCYCDTCLKLAQCYVKQSTYNKAKHIYTNLLNDKYIRMSEQQKACIRAELANLDETPLDLVTIPEKARKENDVSIVLCTKDRAELLDQMLTSLKEAVKDITYEIIVVEGGSSDSTCNVLRRHGVTKVYNEAECMGPGRHCWPRLYNFGFSKARGKWAMFASDDIVFREGCLTKAVEYLNQRGPEVGGGVFFFKNVIESPREEKFGYGRFFIGTGCNHMILMNYGLVRLDYFKQVGGFEQAYQFYFADGDLCFKLYDLGKQLVPLPECFIVHNNLMDKLRQTNINHSKDDYNLYSQRWGHFGSTESPQVGRLVWEKNLVEDFYLPVDMEKISPGLGYFWQGLAYFQRKMFEQALRKFSQAMKNGCEHWKVLWYSAQAAYGCGNFEFAGKVARCVLKLAPELSEAKEFLAKLSEDSSSAARRPVIHAHSRTYVAPPNIRQFESQINPLTCHRHDEILQWAEECEKISERFELPELYERSDNPVVCQGYELVNQVKREFAGRYGHLDGLRILVHVPSLKASPGGYSLFTNLAQGLEFIGVQTRALAWDEPIDCYLDKFKPTVFMTSDNESYLSRINWDYVEKFRKSNTLLIGLTASLEEYGNTPLKQRLLWAKQHKVDFYYSFRCPEYLRQRKEYHPFFENGYNIFSIEFAANPLIHYPVPGIDTDLDYVFLASLNQPKWQRYFAYLSEILSKYPGFLDGPGWSFITKRPTSLNKDRYLYGRAKVGLNLHLDEQIEWASELNERTYILAACGVPQLMDNPKLLPSRFDRNGLFVANAPDEYTALFDFILQNPDEAKRRALIAQKEVFTKHTWFHRAEGLVLKLMENFFDSPKAEPGYNQKIMKEPRRTQEIAPEADTLLQLKSAGLWDENSPLRLHLGCGQQYFKGYINIDYPPSEHITQTNPVADIFADITTLNFSDRSVDEIRLHHVFEHFNRVTALALLVRWHEWLKIGGKLHIETPDLMGSAKTLLSNASWKTKMAVVRHLAGDQADSWAYHVEHWFPAKFEHTLKQLGFASIHTLTKSWSEEPYLSNVEVTAIKESHLSRKRLLAACDRLLLDSMVADVPNERKMHAIWRRRIRAFLDHSESADQVKSQGNSTGGLIFSKDRAMQLQATIESFFLHCSDSSDIELYVLYKASDDWRQRQYDSLKEKFNRILFIEETNFKKQTLSVLDRFDHMLFLVDDNLFVKDFRLKDIVTSLHNNSDAVGFSLRLGRNTNYCYARDTGQNLPTFRQAGNGILKYNWTDAESDFAYPLEVSSSVYRSKDIRPLLAKIEFDNPNTLEGLMAANTRLFSQGRSNLLCYEYSVTFCNPINIVQSVSANRVSQNKEYSSDKLAEMFEEGFSIDASEYSGFTPNSCHQEVELKFRKANRDTGADTGSDRPLVSVEMVTYNAERFIGQAIDSVLAQTYQNFELLIVDDGSTDRTREIVCSYPDSRIRYICKPHQNAASARNKVIMEAKGKYLICVDSDDFIEPDYFEKMVVYAEKHPEIDYFYPAKLALVDDAGNPIGRQWEYLDFSDSKTLPAFLFDQGYAPLPNPGSLKRRTLFNKTGLYEELDTVEDFAFLCKHALKIRFNRVEEHSTYFYRNLSTGLSHKFRTREQITAQVLNDMIAIYPPEILCPKIAEITDPYLSKQQYYKYLMATFYKHAQGYHMVQYGGYFRQYAELYRQRLLQITEPTPAVLLRKNEAVGADKF